MAEKKTFPKLFKFTAKEGTQEWEIWVEKLVSNGFGKMVTRYGLQDGQKQEYAEIISEGKNVGKKNETTPYQQACAEAQSRWNKQHDRKGYGLTVEKSAAVRSVSPMLAHKYKDHFKKVDWETAFAQPKLDGFRLLAVRGEDGKWTLKSRENQPMTAVGHIKAALDEIDLSVSAEDFGTVILDGEAYAHGLSINQIASACKKKSDLSKRIEYHVYDAVLGTADFQTRHKFVADVVEITGSDAIKTVETVKVRAEDQLMHCQAEFIEQGYEGAMLRHGRAGYEAGKRSAHLLKVKTFEDDEFEVVDSKMSRGKYEGCPRFVCRTKAGALFEVLAPGNMAEKRALGLKREKMVGRKLTVKYAYYTKTAEPVPFHPVAKMFR